MVPLSGLPDWRHPEFSASARDTLSLSLGMAAWGLVTGVAMIKSGLSVPLALLMSLTVYAGSAQLASLPLLASGAPLWLVWSTAFAVNLRFVIFSAQWRPFLIHLPRAQRLMHAYLITDMSHVLFMGRFRPVASVEPAELEAARRAQSAYFWGGVSTNWLAWQTASILGIVLAEVIPSAWGLGFAGTLALLGLTASLINDRITVTAAVVAAAASVAAYALPLRLHILVAMCAAVALGVMWDMASKRGGDAGPGTAR